jgi:hypothetical protein
MKNLDKHTCPAVLGTYVLVTEDDIHFECIEDLACSITAFTRAKLMYLLHTSPLDHYSSANLPTIGLPSHHLETVTHHIIRRTEAHSICG